LKIESCDKTHPGSKLGDSPIGWLTHRQRVRARLTIQTAMIHGSCLRRNEKNLILATSTPQSQARLFQLDRLRRVRVAAVDFYC